MKDIPDKKTPDSSHNTNLPGYLRWRHLTRATNDIRLPDCISFLLRIITLTDSVISFNSTKTLTNTLQDVSRTVSHLCKDKIHEIHYRQIKLIFGDIYTYTQSRFKNESVIIIDIVNIENRLMHCEKKAIGWVRTKYAKINVKETNSETIRTIDELISEDLNFKKSAVLDNKHTASLPSLCPETDWPDIRMDIIKPDDNSSSTKSKLECDRTTKKVKECESAISLENTTDKTTFKKKSPLCNINTKNTDPLYRIEPEKSNELTMQSSDKPNAPTINTTECTKPSPGLNKGLSILERIKQRETERRNKFIQMEEEKEREIIKAVHAIFTLAITSSKKSFPIDFITQKISIFTTSSIKITDILTHPRTVGLMHTKVSAEGTTYLLLDIPKYTTHFE
ncbi:hypothetical protein NEIG_02424 [Nematocida sp. ERTm5]|nr:hypothetical protein NEIG_02424 [Nematocida sp. ERTm5]